MIVVFTFVSAIVLLNVLIALMSDVVTETKLSGKQAWLKQKAEVFKLLLLLDMCVYCVYK
jgi:hypothetical protein